MRLGGIVDSAADPANFAVAHEPGEGHSDGSRVAKIGKIVWRERPATAFIGNAPKNLPRMGNRKPGCFHVENNALFFQQIKSRFAPAKGTLRSPTTKKASWRPRRGETLPERTDSRPRGALGLPPPDTHAEAGRFAAGAQIITVI